jgi:tetratricopeptide (TPR) repeat protein
MMHFGKWLLATLLSALFVSSAFAEKYWGLSYQNFDVTTAGSAKNAVMLITNLQKLNAAMSTILGVDVDDNLPIYIFSLPQSKLHLLTPDQKFNSLYTYNEMDADILMDSNSKEDSVYQGAYFGYAGSLLSRNVGVRRYPLWLQQGIAQIFSASRIDSDKVTLGAYESSHVAALAQANANGTLIRAETLLNITRAELNAKSQEFRFLHESQSWFLAHLMLIERQFADSYRAYVNGILQGQDAKAAFLASFPGGYASLDKAISDGLRIGRIQTLVINVPNEQLSSVPVQLNDGDLGARMAFFVVRGKDIDRGIEMAQQAIQTDPDEEYAWRALLVGRMRQKQYSEAWNAMNKLRSQTNLSANARGDVARILAQMAKLPDGTFAESAGNLRVQASLALQKVVDDDPDDIPSLNALYQTNISNNTTDPGELKLMLQTVIPSLNRHPGNEMLLAMAANLSARLGDFDQALQLATRWEAVASSDANKEAATRMTQQLQQLKK